MALDILIKNAVLRNSKGELTDIAISNGKRDY